jgi:hypothetical protein
MEVSMTGTIRRDYANLLGLREGAHYSRMDLHTHSPASECSSFELPEALSAMIPAVKSSTSAAKRKTTIALLERLRDGEAVFDPAAGKAVDEVLWWRPPQASVNRQALSEVAQVWLEDIQRLEKPDGREAIPLLKSAFGDIVNLLKATFFPPEYTLRCYIEQMEIVAITDHNHPGYIVPRLPQLGTWFDAVMEVNEAFLKDIREGSPSGAVVRGMMLERLTRARTRLEGGGAGRSHGDTETRENHKDAKKLRDKDLRLKHVKACIATWSDESHPVRPLTVLPGTEITVSNVHCLSIYPPDWRVPGRIAGILRDIGIAERSWGKGFEAAANASVQRTIDLVDAAGGMVIPAHANSDFKGLLRLFRKGLALQKVLEHPALLALEKIDGTVLAGEGRKRGKDACDTLRWLDTDARAPQRAKLLAFVKGSDAHECRIEVDGTGEDLGVRYTWVKMDIRPRDTPMEVFRALRLALLGGQGRVVEIPAEDTYNYGAQGAKERKAYTVPRKRRVELLDWSRHHPVILGLSVQGDGSYADGVAIRFNPFMNGIVGAAGKSTVLRLVAYAFGALRFLPSTKAEWLPDTVRVFVQDDTGLWSVQREGRHFDPNHASVVTTIHRPGANGAWAEESRGDDARETARNAIEIWPGRGVLGQRHDPGHFSDEEIDRLVTRLDIARVRTRKPLLVHQPREIFHSADLFQRVLKRPVLKFRQILWATVSPNVPTALDAEKLIVTDEDKKAATSRMKVVCGGDLHEDEVIRNFLDRMEGGYAGFARRKVLYEA